MPCQVAHARILTLERRVRESDAALAAARREAEAAGAEAERGEALQLRVAGLEDELRRAGQLAAVLEDKESLLADAVRAPDQPLTRKWSNPPATLSEMGRAARMEEDLVLERLFREPSFFRSFAPLPCTPTPRTSSSRAFAYRNHLRQMSKPRPESALVRLVVLVY